MKVPDTEGVPVMVTTFDVQLPVTPVGRPEKTDPVAPVVANVMLLNAVLIHKERLLLPAPDVNKIVLFTRICPVAVFTPAVQPPVIVTV